MKKKKKKKKKKEKKRGGGVTTILGNLESEGPVMGRRAKTSKKTSLERETEPRAARGNHKQKKSAIAGT